MGGDLSAIPSFSDAEKIIGKLTPVHLDRERVEMEKRILFAFMGVLHCKCEIFEE